MQRYFIKGLQNIVFRTFWKCQVVDDIDIVQNDVNSEIHNCAEVN